MTAIRFATVVGLLALAAGCGGPARNSKLTPPDEVGKPSTHPHTEPVWVDPSIVVSDQQMTLIRSDRVDSIELAPGEIYLPPAPAISFQVTTDDCSTTVNLLSSSGQILQLLLARKLDTGFYKLTVHKPPPGVNPGVPYNYSLQAIVCGNTTSVKITAGWTGPN